VKIVGIEGLQPQQVAEELQRGAKFVIYQYCISVVIMTFKRSSDIYYIRPGESRHTKGIGFTLLSLVGGWWGIPWGPIYTIGALATNLGGGKDVTAEVARSIMPAPAPMAPPVPQPGAWPPPPSPQQPQAPNYYSQPPQ
jgi:hypothetical protein